MTALCRRIEAACNVAAGWMDEAAAVQPSPSPLKLGGHIVVAVIDNELTCKMLYQRGGEVKLQAANPDFPDTGR